MLKPGFALLLFFCFLQTTFTQNKGTFRWVLPVQKGIVPIGTPASDYVAVREGAQVFLLSAGGDRKLLPYDSVSHGNGKFWKVWKDSLQGIYHLDKGELIPPLYEAVRAAVISDNNWAFQVENYGMSAVVDDRNRLVLPYQKASYARLTAVGDTILGYLKHDVYNFVNADLLFVSKNGKAIKDAKIPAPAEFQRISANQYVFTSTQNGKTRRDTFAAAEKFVDDVALVRRDSLWGYLRRDGSWLLSPRFQAAAPFDTLGYAVVKSGGKYGLIKMNGAFQVEPKWAFLKTRLPGLFEMKESGQIGLIDAAGKTIVRAGNFTDFKLAGTQCVAAKSGDTLLLFRRDGTALGLSGVLDCTTGGYDASFGVRLRKQGTAHKGIAWGVMLPDGQWQIAPVISGRLSERKHFYLIDAVLDPCCTVGGFNIGNNQPGKQLIFNKTGTLLQQQTVDEISGDVNSPFLIYKTNGKYGLIAAQETAVPAEFDKIKLLASDWILVQKADQWGILKWVR